MPHRQAPSIVLPTVWALGTEVEIINDLVEHTSIEFEVENLDFKEINILAVEVVVAGVPGPLNIWVELSPYLTTTTGVYWAAIGGGGGAIAPTVPQIIVATGVTLTAHTITIPWTIHSTYARVVVQTPVAAFAATAPWTVQAIVSGRST